MSDAVLVLNAGSSSIKLGVFDISTADPVLLCKGLLDEHQATPRFSITDSKGTGLIETEESDSNGLLADVLASIENRIGDGVCARWDIVSCTVARTIAGRSGWIRACFRRWKA